MEEPQAVVLVSVLPCATSFLRTLLETMRIPPQVAPATRGP